MTHSSPIAFLRQLRRSGVAGVFVLLSLLPLLFNQVWAPIHLLAEHHTGSLLLAGRAAEEACPHPCQEGLDDFHFRSSQHRDHALSHEAEPATPKAPVLTGYLVPGAALPAPAPAAPPPTVPHRHHHPHPASDHDLVALVALLILALTCAASPSLRRLPYFDLAASLSRRDRVAGRSRGPPAFAC